MKELFLVQGVLRNMLFLGSLHVRDFFLRQWSDLVHSQTDYNLT